MQYESHRLPALLACFWLLILKTCLKLPFFFRVCIVYMCKHTTVRGQRATRGAASLPSCESQGLNLDSGCPNWQQVLLPKESSHRALDCKDLNVWIFVEITWKVSSNSVVSWLYP